MMLAPKKEHIDQYSIIDRAKLFAYQTPNDLDGTLISSIASTADECRKEKCHD